MDALLDSLLPYLDSTSFSYMPTVGMEATSLDLYYNHRIPVGYISVDSGRLYLGMCVVFTESFEDSFPSYYNDLVKFLNRFNLKHVMKFKRWDNIHRHVYEILNPKASLVKYINSLSFCKNHMTKTAAKQYVETIRKIQNEFG